jgi:hypothetical protein
MTNARRRVAAPLFLMFGALGLLVLTQVAGAAHPRPRAASPIRVSLVPAYEQCTASNRTHGPPLAFPSCNPPGPASSFLTVGTPDANGAPAKSVGFMKVQVVRIGTPGPPDDDTNVEFRLDVTDVRCQAGTTACGNANAAGGPDYTGEIQGDAMIRISDHWNAVLAGGGTDPATVIDIPTPVTAVCSNTADTTIGGSCSISTTVQPMFPDGGCNCEGRRMVIEFGQIKVKDGGPDGLVASDPQANTEFLKQGIFIP